MSSEARDRMAPERAEDREIRSPQEVAPFLSEARVVPRAVAFIWGGEVIPAPSLPFGRWKSEVLSAA